MWIRWQHTATAILLCWAGTSLVGCQDPPPAAQSPVEALQFQYHYQRLVTDFIDAQGRVIDRSDERLISTSEGQSYALFFALVANDRERFEQLLEWTEDNLSGGDITQQLPAWLWGFENETWGVIDSNPASDADVVIAYTLIEAGRLWNEPRYGALGELVADRILRSEIVSIAGREVLLPAPMGFVDSSEKTLLVNPSYMALPLLEGLFTGTGVKTWQAVYESSAQVYALHPHGLYADWLELDFDFNVTATQPEPSADYDAIRSYFWLALEAERGGDFAELLSQSTALATEIDVSGRVPERIDWLEPAYHGVGNLGFSAILLPYLDQLNPQAAKLQRARIVATAPERYAANYYTTMLLLFGSGAQQCYSFAENGQLQVNWERAWCGRHDE
ncbi:MAG TPA: cellulose synthase complex periplasmic endoglucanase BcsZ [Pseudidiomarina sp.]|nr:cellulose synthase complex periplasmic endoglucanase BcsZ [Pseudidiomarina sp.]